MSNVSLYECPSCGFSEQGKPGVKRCCPKCLVVMTEKAGKTKVEKPKAKSEKKSTGTKTKAKKSASPKKKTSRAKGKK